MQKLKTPQFAKNDNGIYALKRELDEKQAQINKL